MKRYFLYFLLLNFFSAKAQTALDSLTANAAWRNNYDDVGRFNGGLAMVYQNSMYGYVDKKGQTVIPLKYNTISDIKNGYISASDSSNKVGIINIQGKTIVDFKYDLIILEEDGKHFLARKDNKIAYLTISEKEIIPYLYYAFWQLGKDLLSVRMEQNGKEGVIDKKGKLIIPMEYDRIETYPFLHGKINNQVDVLFPNGRIIKNASAEKMYLDTKKILLVTNEDKKIGLFEENGKEVLPCIYEDYRKVGGKFLLKLEGKYGFVSSNNTKKIMHKYDDILFCAVNTFFVKVNKKWGVIKDNENIILPFLYDSLYHSSRPNLIAVLDDKKGIVSIENKILLPIVHDEISPYEIAQKPVYKVSKGNDMSLINDEFRIVVPFEEGKIEDFFKINNSWHIKRNGLYGIFDNKGNTALPYKYKFDLSYDRDYDKNSLSVIIDEKNNTKVIFDVKNVKILTKEYQDILISDDIIILKENGNYAFADLKTKQPITPFEYQRMEIFRRALPKFMFKNDSLVSIEYTAPSAWLVKKNNLFGIVDAQLNLELDFKFDTIRCIYENVYTSDKRHIEAISGNTKKIFTDKYVFLSEIDKNQNYSILSDTFLLMSKNNTTQNYGVLGINNKEIIPFIYDGIESTAIGFYAIKKDKKAFYNLKGKKIIDLTNAEIHLQNGFLKTFIIEKDKIHYGLLDSQGDTIMPFKYKSINILDSVLVVQKQDTNTVKTTIVSVSVQPSSEDFSSPPPLVDEFLYSLNYGVFNFHKKQITPFIYHDVRQKHERFLVVQDEKYRTAVIDLEGNLIIPSQDKNIHYISKSGEYMIVSEKDYYGILDNHNKIIIPMSYEKISHIDAENKYIIAQKGSKYGIIDIKDNIIFPFQYEYLIPKPYSNHLYIFQKSKNVGTLNVLSKSEEFD